MSTSWAPKRPHPQAPQIIGKFAVGRDRLRVYEDIVGRDATPRMYESTHTDIADGLAYTIDGLLMAIRRTAADNVKGLAIVYPIVAAAADGPIPTESRLRSILESLPTETRLRDIIRIRNRSVRNSERVTYTPPAEVKVAHDDVLAFWTSATVVVIPLTGPLPIEGASQGKTEER